jgi:hypothetical protein
MAMFFLHCSLAGKVLMHLQGGLATCINATVALFVYLNKTQTLCRMRNLFHSWAFAVHMVLPLLFLLDLVILCRPIENPCCHATLCGAPVE